MKEHPVLRDALFFTPISIDMRLSALTIFSLFTLLSLNRASAQYIQVNDNYTPQQLVNALVDNSCAQVSNIQLNGSTDKNSHGYFTNNNAAFPFANGIILSTGYAKSATGPNTSLLSEGSTAWVGDYDLETALLISGTINATVLEFDFIPFTDRISFDYLFSSEQYLTSVTSQNQCNYTDGFAFLIKEAGTPNPYQNLAIVPGTNIPVKVNTVRGQGVCPPANEAYFDQFNTTEHATNFNGQTRILQAQTIVTAGTLYHIKLVVADQGNNLYDSAIFLGGGSFKSVTDLGTDRLFETDNPLCQDETLPLNATTLNATGYKWYKDGVLQDETNPIYSVTGAGDYSVLVEFGIGCTSSGKIRIEQSIPPLPGNYTLLQCDDDNDGISAFNLDLAYNNITGNDTSLYVYFYTSLDNALSDTNKIINTTSFQNSIANQVIYAKVLTPYGCYSISRLQLLTSVNTLIPPPLLGICDDDGNNDGYTAFNLLQHKDDILQGLPSGLELRYYTSYADALSASSHIANPQSFTNSNPYNQTIYARIFNGSDCYSIVPVDLVVYTFEDGFTDEEAILCTNETLSLDAGAGFTSYLWNTNPTQTTRSLLVTVPGNYTVTVTNINGCKASKTFRVKVSAPATAAEFIIDDFNGGTTNSVTIHPTGIGNYEFSLDGISYQDSNVFSNLKSGKYSVYINDKNQCGRYIKSFYVLDYPKFFTPNNDGISDSWHIPYLAFIPDAYVTIFDRYGKIITSFTGSGSWDGTFKNYPLPATDYWFVIEINGRIIRGHFSMIR